MGEAQSVKSNSGQGCEQMWLIHENGRLIAPLNWVSITVDQSFGCESVAQAGRVVKTSKEHPPACAKVMQPTSNWAMPSHGWVEISGVKQILEVEHRCGF